MRSKYKDPCPGCKKSVAGDLRWISMPPLRSQFAKTCPLCGAGMPLSSLDRETQAAMLQQEQAATAARADFAADVQQRLDRLREEHAHYRRIEKLQRESLDESREPVQLSTGALSKSQRLELRADWLAGFSTQLMKFGCLLTIAVPVFFALVILLFALFAE